MVSGVSDFVRIANEKKRLNVLTVSADKDITEQDPHGKGVSCEHDVKEDIYIWEQQSKQQMCQIL